jgi:hypothetical protein
LGLVKKASPDTRYSILKLDLSFLVIFLKILFNLFFKLEDVCLLLNLMLNVALATPGIILSAVLLILILVTSKFVG